MHGEAGRRRFCNRVAESAGRVVILDGDDHALGRLGRRDERRRIDRLNRVGIDDPDVDAFALQLRVRLARFEHGHAGGHDGRDVRRSGT